MDKIDVASFADIQDEFIARVHAAVWCNVATIDRQNRPRSRVLHSIWEGATGWIATRRHTLKAKHLEHCPYVSLAYIADVARPVYVDCLAEWADDLRDKRRIWDLFLAAPHPLGYDPAPVFESPEHPNFGLLKLTPWRVELADPPIRRRVWHRP